MDVQKQIDYWRTGSDEDFGAAEALVEKDRFRHSLFFAHPAIEKLLKAHVTRTTQEVPPKLRNLVRLAELAGPALRPEQVGRLRTFNLYQLEGAAIPTSRR
jgi:HEPN domain-containing protein